MEKEEAKEIDRTLLMIWAALATIAITLGGISCNTGRIARALERAYPPSTTDKP